MGKYGTTKNFVVNTQMASAMDVVTIMTLHKESDTSEMLTVDRETAKEIQKQLTELLQE